MIGDDPLDPSVKKSLIAGLSGAPGLGGAFSRAFARPSPTPTMPPSGGPAALSSIDQGPLRTAGVPGLAPSGGTMTGAVNVPGLSPSVTPPNDWPDSGAPSDQPRPAPQPGTIDDVYHHNYSSGSNIDNSGKNKFGRFKAALGHDPTDDEIRQFVAANQTEWEDSTSPTGEYVFRQKQGFLDDPTNLDSKTGARTIWQNRHFVNAAGSGDGYAPPYQDRQAELPGQTGAGPFGYLDPSIAGNPMPNIQDALAAVQRPGTIQEIIARLQRGG